MKKIEITFCVFGYNRGSFLRNCVASIERAIEGAEIIIFDDDSDDPDTVACLKELESRYQIVSSKKRTNNKHGGLYSNMQTALELLSNRSLVCFLQDDTQIVRPVFSTEVQAIAMAFEENPELAFIHPFFIKGSDKPNCKVDAELLSDNSFLFRQDNVQSAGIHYSDLAIFNPPRLIARNWNFKSSEPENDKQAKHRFGKMAYMVHPFAMWLPAVPTYRGKQKTWALAHAERKRCCGFYPFVFWSKEQARYFVSSRQDTFSIAEDHLECSPSAPQKPWVYTPLSGLRFLKLLNSFELKLRRWLRL